MKTTSISRNLMLGLAAIIVFFLLQAAAVLTMGRYTEREVVDVVKRNTIAQISLSELSTLAQQIRRYEKEYFIYVANAEKREQYQKEWTGSMNKIAAVLSTMQANANGAFSSEDSRNITKWTLAAQFYAGEMNKIFLLMEARAKLAGSADKPNGVQAMPLPKTNDALTAPSRMYTSIEANDMIKAGKDQFSAGLIKGVTDTFGVKSQATLTLTSIANEGFSKMIYGVVVTILIGIGIGIYLLITLPRTVVLPIEQLTKSVDAISKGDTSARTTGATVSVKEFHALSSAIERMRVAQEIMVQRMQRRQQ